MVLVLRRLLDLNKDKSIDIGNSNCLMKVR